VQESYFYSNGKLLLSGEYLVLHGAKALAIPLKLGQDLKVESQTKTESLIIHWKSYENSLLWFEMQISISKLEIQKTSDIQIAKKLIDILQNAKALNPDFLRTKQSFSIQTNLAFNKEWGLGSSSTLINNIAKWANVNPYQLLDLTFGGSGYDIACANADHSLFYTILGDSKQIENAHFNPKFKNDLFFVYLGKKQNTTESIHRFNKMDKPSFSLIAEISELGILMAKASTPYEFNKYLSIHETILSAVLKMTPVKLKYFSDFDGEIKSLGAWGGDFVLASSNSGHSYVTKYFNTHSLEVVFKYSDLIK
jgi:mevalonate kinase